MTEWAGEGSRSLKAAVPTRVSSNLTGVADRTQVCRLGVRLVSGAGASGGSAVHVGQVDVR